MPRIGQVARICFEDPKHFCGWATRQVRNPELRAMLLRFANESDDVRSLHEVRQNACTHLAAFLEPHIDRSLSHDDVRIGEMRQRVMTLIIVTPLESKGVLESYRTLCLEQGFAELQSEQFAGTVPYVKQVDELAQSPRMNSVLQAASSLRKFNGLLDITINDYGTLQHIYGREAADTFINNAGVIQFMSTKDEIGCSKLSAMLGEREVFSSTKSVSNPLPGANRGQTSVNETWSKQRKPLLAPFEIRQDLGPRDQIIFMDGVARPILAKKRPYFETALAKLAQPNPFAYVAKKRKDFWEVIRAKKNKR